jgi:hypothetical protein
VRWLAGQVWCRPAGRSSARGHVHRSAETPSNPAFAKEPRRSSPSTHDIGKRCALARGRVRRERAPANTFPGGARGTTATPGRSPSPRSAAKSATVPFSRSLAKGPGFSYSRARPRPRGTTQRPRASSVAAAPTTTAAAAATTTVTSSSAQALNPRAFRLRELLRREAPSSSKWRSSSRNCWQEEDRGSCSEVEKTSRYQALMAAARQKQNPLQVRGAFARSFSLQLYSSTRTSAKNGRIA